MRKAYTLVEALVALAIVSVLILLVANSVYRVIQNAEYRASVAAGRPSPPNTVRLETVKYDNHWWVVDTTTYSHFIHHPDGPCQKPEKE